MAHCNNPQLNCDECGSPGLEIRGPLQDGVAIHCARCGVRRGLWPDFLSDLERSIVHGEEAEEAAGSFRLEEGSLH